MKKNFVTGDILKYFGESVKKIRIIRDYYVPKDMMHRYIVQDIHTKEITGIWASKLYKEAVITKGVSDNEREILTLDKKRKKRLARMGQHN